MGYAPELVDTGFHPLDGARHLRHVRHERVARLVAHHSVGVHEAELRGLATELSEFGHERPEVEEALVFCDVTTGPTGERMTLENLGFHELRHAAASAMVAAGVDLRTAQVRLGHSDPRLTMGVYAQASPESDRAAAERLGEHFLGQDDVESDGECAMDVP